MSTTPEPLPLNPPPPDDQPATPTPTPAPEPSPSTPPDTTPPKKRFSIADATPEQRSEWGKRGALKRAANKAAAAATSSTTTATAPTVHPPSQPPPPPQPTAPPKLDITKPEDRSTRGTNAVKARWDARNLSDHEWQTMPLLDAERHLASMRIEVEHVSRILQQRYQLDRDKPVTCIQCHTSIQPGRWAQMKQERNPSTGLVVIIYLCSERCIKLHHDAATAPLPGPPKGDPHAPSQYAAPTAK